MSEQGTIFHFKNLWIVDRYLLISVFSGFHIFRLYIHDLYATQSETESDSLMQSNTSVQVR